MCTLCDAYMELILKKVLANYYLTFLGLLQKSIQCIKYDNQEEQTQIVDVNERIF